MDFDLWLMIQDCFGLNAFHEIAEVIEEDPSKVREGIRQSVPAILQCLVATASTEEGREKLAHAIRNSPAEVRYQLREHLAGSKKEQYSQAANAQVANLVGDDLTNPAAVLSRKSGMRCHAAREVLTMMTPVVVSAIAQLQRQRKFCDSELASILQKELDDLSRHKASYAEFTLNLPELVKLVEAVHREFGTHERISSTSLVSRIDLSKHNAEQLRRELQWTGRLESVSQSLTAAAGLADRLVGRVYHEIGPHLKLTSKLLCEKLEISPRRADNLMNDMRRRGILNTAGALASKFRTYSTKEDAEATGAYLDYLRQNGEPSPHNEVGA